MSAGNRYVLSRIAWSHPPGILHQSKEKKSSFLTNKAVVHLHPGPFCWENTGRFEDYEKIGTDL